jgi:hypothetical protein
MIWGLAVAAWAATASFLFAEQDPYVGLAQDLAGYVKQDPVEIGIGDFLYEDTALLSPFSSLLREELERALPKTGKFKVITRSRLADLQIEDRFQTQQAFEPGVTTRGLKISAVKALVRGRFYYKYPVVTVSAELVWLEGGEVQKTKLTLPVETISTRIWPDTKSKEEAMLANVVRPQQVAASVTNVLDVSSRLSKVPHDFPIQLVVNEGKRDFAEGETISYRVQSATACHIAILCHQVDGSTVMLFPNEYQRETWVAAGTGVTIPVAGKDNFQFKVQQPFGADVVQVIACTKRSALHQLIQQQAAQITKGMGVRGLDRGIVVEAVAGSLAGGAGSGDGAGPTRWAESHIVVCTYPKYGGK